MTRGRKAAAAALLTLGCAWPFAAHGLGMTRLHGALSQDPGRWLAYAIVVAALPCPALLFSGFMVLVRDQMPFPANALVSGAGAAALLAVVAAAFFLAVGLVGFTVPF